MTPAQALDLLDATWPAAERVAAHGWMLRRGDGGGSRVGSARPAPDPRDWEAGIEALTRQAAAWGQPALAQVPDASPALDAALAARGWAATDPTLVLAAPAATVAATVAAAGDARMALRVRAPLRVVDETWAAGGIGPARRAVMARAPAPCDVLMVRDDDRCAALGFVAAAQGVAGGAAMLHAAFVAPAFRRRGVGRALTAAAAAWALEHGARTLALAVEAANAPARALYDGLGFAQAGGYRYRRAPDAAPRGDRR